MHTSMSTMRTNNDRERERSVNQQYDAETIWLVRKTLESFFSLFLCRIFEMKVYTYIYIYLSIYWPRTGSVDTIDLILIPVQYPFDILHFVETMMLMRVSKEKNSFHRSNDLDAKNEPMAMVMLLMMNDMNDNFVDDVHVLFQEFVLILCNDFSMV